MGRSSGKNKKQAKEESVESTSRQTGMADSSPRTYDRDTAIFIAMSQELKDEGNRHFQKRDCEGALLKYEKALKLLPRNHIDVAYLRSNMAACYMQLGISDYPRAVHECNLALEVSPKYGKALIKRARCYEGLNRLELALRDLNTVLSMEPNNLTALELVERVKQALESRGDGLFDHPVPDYVESPCASSSKGVKEKPRKKKSMKNEKKSEDEETREEEMVEKLIDDKGKRLKVSVEKKGKSKEKKRKSHKKVENKMNDKELGDDVVVEEKITIANGDELKKNVKLVFGEDIRWAHIPVNCSVLDLRVIIQDRFPTSRAILVKYKDEEGDMITITTDEELRWAEESEKPQGSVKLYIVEVSPEYDLFYEKLSGEENSFVEGKANSEDRNVSKKAMAQGPLCIEEWIIHFARLFKNYVGFSSDAYLDLHEIGVKLYSEAMEEIITSEEAQVLFDMAAEKFQEMAALALFNWGNVHMARARKRVHFAEGSSEETMLDRIKDAYDWTQQEYVKAGMKYEEALKIKPNFYEGHLALAQQQFEQAKLAWYYVVSSDADIDSWPSAEVLDLYNCAEENIAKGMQTWEETEQLRQDALSNPNNSFAQLQKMGLDQLYKDVSTTETEEQAMTMRSQINVLWGTMLYERSIMEFKLGVPVWHESLEVAVEKFEQAGASPTDIAVMVKNHCSNDTAPDGVGFKIDEIVQAWNEMDDAKRWYSGVPSFRLEPLLRRRMSEIYYALDTL